jgi:hypothetical protein
MGKNEEQEYILDELLLRRTQLHKLAATRRALFAQSNLYKENINRSPVRHEQATLDQVSGIIPRLKKEQVEEEVNFYAQKLREVDAVVQQQNFSLDVVGAASIFVDFSSDPDKMKERSKGEVTKKLAEFLTRRKQLNDLCRSNLGPDPLDLIHEVNERIEMADGVERIREKVENLTAAQALAKSDYYHRQLQLVDVVIHKANNGTKVKASTALMSEFE